MPPPRPAKARKIHLTPPAKHPTRKAIPQDGLPTGHLGSAAPTMEDVFTALTETQSKSNPNVPSRGLMFPGRLAQLHPAGPMLKKDGTDGCPVEITADWSLEQLDKAVDYGAHPSASDPDAAKALRAEALEKVEQGFAKLVPWKNSKLKSKKTSSAIPKPVPLLPSPTRADSIE